MLISLVEDGVTSRALNKKGCEFFAAFFFGISRLFSDNQLLCNTLVPGFYFNKVHSIL